MNSEVEEPVPEIPLSFNIQATDGTLFPSAARYRGCCHFNDSCASITVDNVVHKVRDRVLYRI